MPRHPWSCRPRKLTRSEQRVGPFLRDRLTGTKFKSRYYHGLGIEKCPHHEDLSNMHCLSLWILEVKLVTNSCLESVELEEGGHWGESMVVLRGL